MPVSLGHHGGVGGRFKFAAPALWLLAFWVERRVVPPASHVNITTFESFTLAGEISYGQACDPLEDFESRAYGNTGSKKANELERATGIEPA
jgi:hypothetical protein